MGIVLGGLHKTGLQHQCSAGAAFLQDHSSHLRPPELPQITETAVNAACTLLLLVEAKDQKSAG